MSDTRPICVACEVSMKCEKNSVTIKYGRTGRQQCDLYICPICGNQILTGCGLSYYPRKETPFEYTRNERP